MEYSEGIINFLVRKNIENQAKFEVLIEILNNNSISKFNSSEDDLFFEIEKRAKEKISEILERMIENDDGIYKFIMMNKIFYDYRM